MKKVKNRFFLLRQKIITLSATTFDLPTVMGLKYSAISVNSETGVWCGNTEMLCSSIGKLSEKSYLSRQNPTCPVSFYTFDTCKHSCWFMRVRPELRVDFS